MAATGGRDDVLGPTARTGLRRKPERGRHDRATVHACLDAGFVGHLGFSIDGRPWVVPMAYGRVDDRLVLHGSAANHALRSLAGGIEACFTVTHVDGLVLSRSAFHTSINYRSVMVFGTATRVEALDERRSLMLALVDAIVPGQAAVVRPPAEHELRATLVLTLPIAEASAKVRTGPPIEEPEDLALATWAGELPLRLTAGRPVADEHVPPGVAAPAHVLSYPKAAPTDAEQPR